MPKIKGGTFSRKNLITEKKSKNKRRGLQTQKLDDWKSLFELEKNDYKTAKDPIKCQLGEL